MTTAPEQKFPTFHQTFPAMGTRCDVVLPNLHPEIAAFIYQEIQVDICLLESKLSRFQTDSPISEINRYAHERAIRVDLELWDVLTTCRHFHFITDGAFDVTVLPLLQKNQARYAVEKPKSGFHHVELNSADMSIRFTRPGMGLDLGGIGKGYALENVKRILQTHNIKRALISFGESSIMAWGNHPHGDHWPVSIRHMRDEKRWVHEFEMKDQALSTSANGFSGNGTSIHIFDPRAGTPAAISRAVSVVSRSPLEAEVLSTALLVLRKDEQKGVIRHFPGCQIAEMQYGENVEVEVVTY
ncbi:FAD:protein FMN transferase [candidate division KSB1 bacterium]|nr:FAD:protein FMN transferase [candidate division KSB1 bacterium]